MFSEIVMHVCTESEHWCLQNATILFILHLGIEEHLYMFIKRGTIHFIFY